ncbi:MAG TPA: hypothetical protein DCQ32_01665 [Cyanobacteria bacterium UBA8156]|jgi:hypothetical protein|nr:hypothetical protein [Cyanobacteria bacterium UBA8156]
MFCGFGAMNALIGWWLMALTAAFLIRFWGSQWPTLTLTPQLQAIALLMVVVPPLVLGLILRARASR